MDELKGVMLLLDFSVQCTAPTQGGRGTGLGMGIVKGADMGCRDSEWVCQGKVRSMDVGSVYSAFGLMCNLTVRSCA